ncbi:O-methylsterigmatocystin oxidoreductase [Leucoagaricus sp. SymC.cos]|nr:O-methylsterigmatocystin oxidoreductase [Leucoagaricus sp. SymC.cos]
MATELPALLIALVSSCILWALFYDGHNHPPGPPGIPFIGDTGSSIDILYEGKIFRLRVLRDNFIILNDPKVAEDLVQLGRRSTNYSSRKFLPYAGFYRSGDRRMILMGYGEEFVKQRAAMQMLFRPQGRFYLCEIIAKADNYLGGVISNRARQEQQAKKFLFDMLTTPEDYALHLKRYSAGIALGVAWGMSIEAAEEETFNLINNTAAVGADLFPGLWLVDMFQWLDKFPSFLARWRPGALKKHEDEIKLFTRFASHANSDAPIVLQTKPLVAQLWESQDESKLDDRSILYIGGSVGEAGPDVVKKAQEELDRVVGDRPPTFNDFNSLPYLFAVVKEVLRWIPVTPLSFPHLASEDDEYEGYFIPKGSQVVASIWNMHRSPELFCEPSKFEPMRWYDPTPSGTLKEDASLFNGVWTFGFGRRGCPGKRLAVDSVWIGVAHLLWAFNVEDKDPEAAMARTPEEVDANLCWRDAVNIEPRMLHIKILPRSQEKADRVQKELAALKSN